MASHQLQICLGDIRQTKQVSTKHHVVFPSHPQDKPACVPGQTDLPHKKIPQKTEQ
jgi:hypothetical protein